MTRDVLPGSPAAPPSLTAEHTGWLWEVAGQGVPSLVTYRLTHESGAVRYLKLSSGELEPGLEAEAARMRWCRRHAPAPVVLAHGHEAGVDYLLTERLAGRDGTDPTWTADVAEHVRALGRGLRRFHDLPVDACPFDFRLDRALGHVRRRVGQGRIDGAEDFHEEFAHMSPEEALLALETTRPSTEDLVVCHGDYCPPNVLLTGGHVVAYLDLGEVGVADRWWDLAVATWSVTWNFGPGLEDVLLDEYGVERDEGRVRYYRLLYDCAS